MAASREVQRRFGRIAASATPLDSTAGGRCTRRLTLRAATIRNACNFPAAGLRRCSRVSGSTCLRMAPDDPVQYLRAVYPVGVTEPAAVPVRDVGIHGERFSAAVGCSLRALRALPSRHICGWCCVQLRRMSARSRLRRSLAALFGLRCSVAALEDVRSVAPDGAPSRLCLVTRAQSRRSLRKWVAQEMQGS